MTVLSKAERDGLDKGKRCHVHVHAQAAYDYERLTRPRQGAKNKTIEDFAVRFLNQCRRWGLNQDDERHINALVNLLDKEVQRAQRDRRKSNITRTKAA